MSQFGNRLLVISDFPPYVTGGAERQAWLLARELQRLGWQIEVAGRAMPPRFATLDGFQINSHRIYVTPRFGKYGSAITYFFSLVRILLKRRRCIDLVYCRFLGDAAVTVSILKAVGLLSQPLVACPANAGPMGDVSYVKGAPGSALWTRCLRSQLTAINVISDGIAGSLKEIDLEHVRQASIPNGVMIRSRSQSVDTDGPVRIVFVGRLAPQKDVSMLISAFRSVSADPPPLLTIVGDGPLRASLEQQAASLQISSRLRFVGEKTNAEVSDLLRESDCLVLPSRWEGFSNAALEAMAHGLPVIATRCGGIDRLIDESIGWTCSIGDAAGLTRALTEAANSGRIRLHSMGGLAQQRIMTEYDIAHVAARHSDLFRELIEGVNHVQDTAEKR